MSPIAETELEACLANSCPVLRATADPQTAFASAEFIVVATPTDYDPQTNQFDTSSVDEVVRQALRLNKSALVVIKSTVPVGYTTPAAAVSDESDYFLAGISPRGQCIR